jgi:hypothetical protein
MSTASAPDGHELIVAPDGSIPAEQLARLGLAPGAHLRVVADTVGPRPVRFEGSLSELPDITWEDFERGSELARSDLNPS